MLERVLRRIMKKRNFEAAAPGRRWKSAPAMANLAAASLAQGGTIAKRAEYYVASNAHARSAVSAIVANAIGAGIKPQSTHPSEAFREEVHRRWLLWTDLADANGLTDFYGLQALAVRTMAINGEAFARMLVRPVNGRPTLQLQLVHPDQVDRALSRDLGDGRRIVGGIEFDGEDRRIAYHLLRHRPGDPLATAFETLRVPASEMIHMFNPETPGQVRGVSWLASVLLRLHEIDGFEDAQLMRQRVAALFAGFVTDLEGNAGGFAGEQTDGVLESGMEPGTLKVLPPGTDIKFSDPADVGDVGPFLAAQLRAVAAGIGCTYEQMTGDLSSVNYSSIRAGLVEFRRRIEALQHNAIVFMFCRPVWERWLRLQVLSGAIAAPGFETDPAPFLAVKWIPPKTEWVDPLKDAQAAIAEIDAGLRSRAEVVSGRGYDVEALDAEIAADQARAKRLGLSFGKGAGHGNAG